MFIHFKSIDKVNTFMAIPHMIYQQMLEMLDRRFQQSTNDRQQAWQINKCETAGLTNQQMLDRRFVKSTYVRPQAPKSNKC